MSKDELNNLKINTYISSEKYQANESHWSFIFIRDDFMKIATYKRSANSDILGRHEFNTNILGKIPLGFEPRNCVSFANAGVVKVVFNNRRYLILGEIK